VSCDYVTRRLYKKGFANACFSCFAAKKHGLDDVPSQVVSLISHATQERLRNIVEKLANIAEHRLEIYKVGKLLAYFAEVIFMITILYNIFWRSLEA